MSTDLLHSLYSTQRSCRDNFLSRDRVGIRRCLGDRFLTNARGWSVYKVVASFKRRVTCVEWHPTYSDVVSVGSHGGDLLLLKYESASLSKEAYALIEGVGYGHGCITSMKFHPTNSNCMYATSVDGTFRLHDFTGKKSTIHLDTQDYRNWWVSFDQSLNYNVLFVGDNRGSAVLLSPDGKVIKTLKHLHRSKIKHAEFCPSQNWTLVTSSADHTVALWDIRMLSCTDNLFKPVTVQKHGSPVNAAHFDPLTGTRLLTTAQDGKLRLYDSHDQWEQPTITIDHAHRHFQHLTDIVATWHPLYDNLCLVGRYPRLSDQDKTRTIDFINLDTGRRNSFFYSSFVRGIMTVNKFNQTGEALASGEGSRMVMWKAQDILDDTILRGKDGQSGRMESPQGVPGMTGTGTRKSPKKGEKKNVLKMKSKRGQSETLSETAAKRMKK